MELTSDQPLDIVRRRASKHMTVQHIESHLVQLIRYWIEAPFSFRICLLAVPQITCNL